MIAEFFGDILAVFADPPRILEWDMLLRIAIQILLFAASAFFSGSETALFSLSRFELQRLARARHPASETLNRLLEQPRRLIVSILCGNELINIAAAANMTAILVELMGVEAAAWAAAFVMIPLILVFGEVTPKTLAVSNPVWVGTRIVAAPMNAWFRIAAPLAFVVRVVADRVTTLAIGPERTKENILHVEELRTLIEEGVKAGEITATERLLVHGLLSAGATEVREIMTPRAEVAFIDGDLPDDVIRAQFFGFRRTRVPVYRGNRDTIQGFLYVEDLIETSGNGDAEGGIAALLHRPLAVPVTKDVDEMLDFFDEHDARAALVVNEFGAVEGIVTLADVTRLLFAGVFEEATPDVPDIVEVEDGFEIEGGATIDEIRKATGIDIDDPVMKTIAGVALRAFGRVPNIGDSTDIGGFTLVVTEVTGLRITRVHLRRDAPNAPDAPSSTEGERPA